MSMKCITPSHIPHLYSKTGVYKVYRGIPIFLIFDPTHILWVLFRIIINDLIKYEPVREKTNNQLGSDQVCHKPSCTSTEAG